MTPFAIKVTLASPLVFAQSRHSSALCLDAVLAGLRRARGLDPLDLPLQQTHGVWHASAAFMRCGREGYKRTVHFTRSVDNSLQQCDRFMRNHANARASSDYIRVGDSEGDFKQLMNAYDRLTVATLHWWGCGDVEAVREILSLLVVDDPDGPLPGYGLGRHANGGYGEVARVNVAPRPEDRSLAVGHRPMRPVPVPVWQALGHPIEADTQVASCAWRYPYYHTEKARCVVPPTQIITGRIPGFINP